MPRAGLVLVGDLLRRCRVDIPVVWVDSDAGLVGGMVWPQLRRRLRGADLLLDIGGHCWLQERSLPKRRALLDVDPGEGPAPARSRGAPGATTISTSPTAATPTSGWPPSGCRRSRRSCRASGTDRRRAPSCRSRCSSVAAFEEGGLGPHQGEGIAGEELLALPARLTPRPWTALRDDGSELAAQLAAAGWSVRAEAAVDGSLSAHRGQLIGSQACLSFRRQGADGVWFTAHDACFLAAGRPLIVARRRPRLLASDRDRRC